MRAELTAPIRRRVDIDIALAGFEIGDLRVGQSGRAGDRAIRALEWHGDASICASSGAAMDVRRLGRSTEPEVGDGVRDLLGRRSKLTTAVPEPAPVTGGTSAPVLSVPLKTSVAAWL